MADPTPPARRRRRLARAAAVAAGLLAAYTAFGFLAAPVLLRRALVTEGAAALHRDVAVAKVRVNPLALSVTVEGLAVTHRDGAPFAGWESLHVRLAPLRLLAGEIGIAEIRLVRPAVHVGLRADGALTFQDLLEGGAEAPAPAAPAGEPDEARTISIGRLAVEDARLTFRDETRRPAFETALGPLTVRLESFRTRGGRDSPYSFTGTTDAGETFRWTGTVRTQPFHSAGTLAFERIALPRYAPYLRDDLLPADLHGGLVDVETRYEVEWGPERRTARTSAGRIVVDGLALAPRGADAPAVRLPRVEIAGVEADVLATTAKVAEVALRGGAVRVVREADGSVDLARMVPPPSDSPPWTWSVGAVTVSGLALSLEDRTPPRPVALALGDVQVRVEELRSDADSSWPLSLSLAWNGAGRLAAKGAVRPFRSQATLGLDASDLDLVPLQPYLEPAFAARLDAARAGAKVKVEVDASGAAPRWTLAGDVRLERLAVAERGNPDLLRWRALEISGIDARSTPPRATVRLVRLVEPRARLYVWEDGATSLARALPAPAPAPGGPATPSTAASGPAWRTAIGAVQIVRGRATFVDRSVAPEVVLHVTGADAAVTRLSSDPKVRSTVDVRLELEGASPVVVTGTLNPLQQDAYTDLVVASQGVDLSPAAPYAGKFLGYGIQKGKLDLDLRYEVQDRTLAATNVVKIDQLTLGEATDSPDATRLPVRLALALLKDRHGVILLDVPVEGNLDDPEFRLGKVIWRTVLNLLAKVATSPFKALAALAGGGEDADLSIAEFEPGTADPLPQARERLAMLARSLAERPEVALELEGAADPAVDGPALRRAALERSLRQAKAATLRPPPASADEVTVAPDERPRLVLTAYGAAFPAPERRRGEPAPPAPTPAEMEERLAAAVDVADDVYRSLASARADRARQALLAAGLAPARLFLAQGGERARQEKGARVYFVVK